MLKTYHLFFLALFFNILNAIKFNFFLDKKDLRCFGDNLGRNVIVVGSVNSTYPEYSFKIHVNIILIKIRFPHNKWKTLFIILIL